MQWIYGIFQVHSFDQGICTYVWVTLCTPEKGRLFPFPFLNFTSRYVASPPSLILLTILSVFLLHSAVMSHPSYLAGKGEELRIQKTQTYNTFWPSVESYNYNNFKLKQGQTGLVVFQCKILHLCRNISLKSSQKSKETFF